MSTEFTNIKRPIRGEFIEIGQPTFTELISVRQETTTPAIGASAPNVRTALKKLAFGRSCESETTDSATIGMLTAIPQRTKSSTSSSSTVSASKYSVNGKAQKATKQRANLGAAKTATEFRSLVANPPIVAEDAPACFGTTLLDTDDWTNGDTSLQGWSGDSVAVVDNTLQFSSEILTDTTICKVLDGLAVGDIVQFWMDLYHATTFAVRIQLYSGDDLLAQSFTQSPGLHEVNALVTRTGPVKACVLIRGSTVVETIRISAASFCYVPHAETGCDESDNELLNGSFNNNISGWTAADAEWDDQVHLTFGDEVGPGSAKIADGGNITQRLSGLQPGNTLLLNYNWCTKSLGQFITDFDFTAVKQTGSGGDWIDVPTTPETVLLDGLQVKQITVYPSGFGETTSKNLVYAYDFSSLPDGFDVANIKFLMTYDIFTTEHGITTETTEDFAFLTIDGTNPTGNNGSHPGFFVRIKYGNQVGIRYIMKYYGAKTQGEGEGLAGDPTFTTPLTTTQLKTNPVGLVYHIHNASNPLSVGVGNAGIRDFAGTTLIVRNMIAIVSYINPGTITGELLNSSGSTLQVVTGSPTTEIDTQISTVIDDEYYLCSENRHARNPLRVKVPTDGIVDVRFSLEGDAPSVDSEGTLYIDEASVCQYRTCERVASGELLLFDNFTDSDNTRLRNHIPLEGSSTPDPLLNIRGTDQSARATDIIVNDKKSADIVIQDNQLTLDDRVFVYQYGLYETRNRNVRITADFTFHPYSHSQQQTTGIVFRAVDIVGLRGYVGTEYDLHGLACLVGLGRGEPFAEIVVLRPGNDRLSLSFIPLDGKIDEGQSFSLDVAVDADDKITAKIETLSDIITFTATVPSITTLQNGGTIHGVYLDAFVGPPGTTQYIEDPPGSYSYKPGISQNIDNIRITSIGLDPNECACAGNFITNPKFEAGVDGWTDANDTPLSPTDSTVWDSELEAAIVDIAEKSEVRQTITNMQSGKTYAFVLTLASYEPNNVDELVFIYGVLDSSDNKLVSRTRLNAGFSLPESLAAEFTVPADGIVKIFFKVGNPGGKAKIQDCLICDFATVCEPGYSKVSFDDFTTDKGAWSGGVLDLVLGQVLLDESGNITDIIRQTFTDLEASGVFQLTLNVRGDGGVTLRLIGSDGAQQLLTGTSAGVYTIEKTIPEDGVVIAEIERRDTDINVDDILCCQRVPQHCEDGITSVQCIVEWQGIPRRPTNLFNAAVKYTFRNPDDPLDLSEDTILPSNEGRLGIATCDFWKSQFGPVTTILRSSLTQSQADLVEDGDMASVANRTNWLWSIPTSAADSKPQDNLVINFPDSPAGLIENVEILLLVNRIIPVTGTDTSPVNPAPLDCDPDPATKFDVILRYENNQGLQREFSISVSVDDLWTQTIDYGIGVNPWDTVSSTGNGLNGSVARWEGINFLLDSPDGHGLDQCSAPISFSTQGSGDLAFGDFGMIGRGVVSNPCEADVLVETVTDGSAINEIQSIILPSRSGGTWTLSLTLSGETGTATLPWNTTADQIQVRLGRLPNVMSSNLSVSGTGTNNNPFLVEFVNELGAKNIPKMVADGTNLTGAGAAMVTTLNNGTTNERQRITNSNGTKRDLVITFGGVDSVPIPYGSSLDFVQSALSGMSTIGAGNIQVTGNNADRSASYVGPYIVDFVGSLANTNVVEMTADPAGYVVHTDWNGGSGAGQNEKQTIEVDAFGGTFALRVFNQTSTVYADTAPISWNAAASDIKNALVTAAGFLTNADIGVTSVLADDAGGQHIWRIEFKGTYAKLNMPVMTANGDSLLGGVIKVKQVQNGDGQNEKQHLTIINATSGSFTLTVNINGEDYTTTAIPWNTTADGLQAQLLALKPFGDEDLTVKSLPTTDSSQRLRVAVTFKKKFGNIPLLVSHGAGTLFCNPVALGYVPVGPFNYQLADCCDIDEDLSCQSGPLLCHPCEGDDEETIELCCNADTIPNSANVSTRLCIQRDLFDSNSLTTPATGTARRLTIRELAVLKGLKPSDYTPYLRNFNTQKITATSYSTQIDTKMSVVLIENELDTARGRQRVVNHLTNHREILPARFIWPDCDTTKSDPSSACWPEIGEN